MMTSLSVLHKYTAISTNKFKKRKKKKRQKERKKKERKKERRRTSFLLSTWNITKHSRAFYIFCKKNGNCMLLYFFFLFFSHTYYSVPQNRRFISVLEVLKQTRRRIGIIKDWQIPWKIYRSFSGRYQTGFNGVCIATRWSMQAELGWCRPLGVRNTH